MYSTEMTLFLSTSLATFHHQQLLGTSLITRKLVLPATGIHRYPLISSFHTARSKTCYPFRTISCLSSSAISGDGTREEASSTASIFVKGLSDSVSEGRLKKIFSEFGQVTHVKIIINERTRQSRGYGYVWFNSKEDAELAVEAMNGKFFDGRFILVKFGQPGLSRRPRSDSDFRFVNN